MDAGSKKWAMLSILFQGNIGVSFLARYKKSVQFSVRKARMTILQMQNFHSFKKYPILLIYSVE